MNALQFRSILLNHPGVTGNFRKPRKLLDQRPCLLCFRIVSQIPSSIVKSSTATSPLLPSPTVPSSTN